MQVLLINPPSEDKNPILPLGLASIAAFLEHNGVDVKIIDAWALALNYEDIVNEVKEIEADIIGITMVSPRYNQAKKTAEAARRGCPNATIVLGGPHPSALPTETLQDIPEVDICVIGEGEQTMLDLVNALSDGDRLHNIKGIAFRTEDSVVVTDPRPPIKDLDSLPMPARHLFPIEKYKTHPPYGRKNPYMTMMTSRGCPFSCAYCSKETFGNRLRMMSAKKVVEEIEFLVNQYGTKEIHFYDDTFTVNMKRVRGICDEIIDRKIDIIWSCTTRVNVINEELLRKMKEAGCWLISYGVESGSQEILDAMGKGITIEQVSEAFKMTRKQGIKILAFFMMGFLGETEEDIQKTIDFSKQLKPDFVSWDILKIFPGSKLYRLFVKEGKLGRHKRLQSSDGDNVARNPFGYGSFTFLEDNLTIEQLQKEIRRANREFYIRPTYALNVIISIRSLWEFIHYLRGGIAVIKSVRN